MGVRKLRTVFMKYAIFLALGVFLVAFVNIAFYLFGVEIGFIYPINRMSAEIENARGSLQSTDRITENEIPPLCEYALFTKDGKYIGGSLDLEETASVWKMCIVNNQTSSKPYLYAVIDRTDEILILRYRMTAQFSNPLLHRIFLSADWVLIAVIILEILLLLIVLSYLFGKYLGNKMDKLLTAVKKIEQQDLNFEVEKSHLYEIDLTLDALNHMKLALKKSLTEQWQADKLRQEQISALAHDLKTPLTIIRGNTELLYDTDLTTEQQECADYITDSYTQMQVYVKTLIDLSTASTGYQLNKEIFHLSDYLKQVKASINALCRTKEIHLRMSVSDIPIQLTADKVLLGRAIQNVVNNALDYSPQDGTLHIDVCGKDNFVEISVTDEGEGFSNEALQHAQEQFFMDDQSRNSKLHFGMGLYIAKSIMEQHSGELVLENSKSTGGAKVILKIPFDRMGGFYSHPFFANLYEIFKTFSYYISKVNDLPSDRKEKTVAGQADSSCPNALSSGGFDYSKPPFLYPPAAHRRTPPCDKR